MNNNLVWQIEEQTGRLDALLAQKYPDYSRSYFQKLIEQGCVIVEGKVVTKPRHEIKSAQQITVNIPAPVPSTVVPHKVDFEVIDQQPDFMVINKPAGLIVHPAASAPGEITLVHGLLHSFAEINEIDSAERPGIVHRIDKDTSGLLIVARHEKAHFALSKLFKDRQIHKKYLALVKGHTPERGTIDYAIGRHPTQRHKMSHTNPHGRSALTHYAAVQYFEDHTLVEVTIITGRTHQVRVHMAAIGYPLIGDAVYGVQSPLIGRQALHAWKCSFEYDGKMFNYECPVPADIQGALSKLQPLEA